LGCNYKWHEPSKDAPTGETKIDNKGEGMFQMKRELLYGGQGKSNNNVKPIYKNLLMTGINVCSSTSPHELNGLNPQRIELTNETIMGDKKVKLWKQNK
jgi:hypothetical protein